MLIVFFSRLLLHDSHKISCDGCMMQEEPPHTSCYETMGFAESFTALLITSTSLDNGLICFEQEGRVPFQMLSWLLKTKDDKSPLLLCRHWLIIFYRYYKLGSLPNIYLYKTWHKGSEAPLPQPHSSSQTCLLNQNYFKEVLCILSAPIYVGAGLWKFPQKGHVRDGGRERRVKGGGTGDECYG